MFSEHLFLKIPLEGYICYLDSAKNETHNNIHEEIPFFIHSFYVRTPVTNKINQKLICQKSNNKSNENFLFTFISIYFVPFFRHVRHSMFYFMFHS